MSGKDVVVCIAAARDVPDIAPAWRDVKDRRGTPMATLANAVIAIKALAIECRQDLFHHVVLVSYRGELSPLADRVGELTDDTLGAIRSLINNQFCLDVGEKHTVHAVMEIARDNAFDPVLDYLRGVEGEWDGVERITRWLVDYCGAEDTEFNRAVGRKHLIASVRRARQPGVKYDDVLVMELPEGKNKSSAIEILAGRENFSDQTILGMPDRVAQELIEGVFLYEIADLTGITRADVDKIKAFASRNTDRARPAYGRVVEKRPRRCTFWGTTNDDHYLKSQTGNRRFLPVKVDRVDLDALRRDRDQLWGEAAAAETAGELIMLAEQLWSAAADEQEKRRVLDPWEEILADIPETVDIGDNEGPKRVIHRSAGEERVTTYDLLTFVLRVPLPQQNTNHGQRLAGAMKKNGWQRPATTIRIEGRPTRGYRRPIPLVLKGGDGAKR